MKILPLHSNRPLAEAISAYLNVPLTQAAVRRFSDMEVFVEIPENVRGEDMFIIQSTSYPANDNLMELLVGIDAMRRSSARRDHCGHPLFRLCPAGPSNRAANANFRETGGQSSHYRRCRSGADDGPPCRPNPRLFRHSNGQSLCRTSLWPRYGRSLQRR